MLFAVPGSELQDAIRSFKGVLTSGVEQITRRQLPVLDGRIVLRSPPTRDALTHFKAVVELQRSGKKADAHS